MQLQYRHLAALVILLLSLLPAALPAQSWQWARLGRGTDHDAASRVAVDSLGNSYVLGRFAGTISLNTTLLSGLGLWDLYVAKYNPQGALQWATSITGGGNDLPGDIAVDRAGNVYVSGSFGGTTILAGRSVTSAGNSDVFVAKLNPTGVVMWARTGGGAGDDFATGLDLDEPEQYVYICGSFNGTAAFSGDLVTSIGGSDVFIARYATLDGGIQWVRAGGGPEDDAAAGLGVDRFGSAFIAGTFADSAVFLNNRVTMPDSDSGAVFVLKVDFAGIPRFAIATGVLPRAFGPISVAVDPEGNTYVAGSFRDSITMGTTTLVSAGGYDVFLARVNPFGGFRWALREGDTLNDFGLGVGVDNVGNAYVTGALDNTGTMTLDTTYTERLFVARYTVNGERSWIEVSPGGRIERGLDVGLDRLGNHYVGGQFFDTLRLDDVRLAATGGRSDAFIARLGPDASIVTSSLSDTVACAGGTFNVGYSIGGNFFSDNRFIVQLSDTTGSFAMPTVIGTRATAAAGTILTALPAYLPTGTRYRIRVISTSPYVEGSDNGRDIDIIALPRPIITAGIDDTLCSGESVLLDAGPGFSSYRWSTGASSQTITVSQSGRYSVAVTTDPGCDGRSDTATIVVLPEMPKPVITRVGNRLEVHAGYTHQWYRNGVAIQGATRERFTPTESGTYTVTVFDIDGCSITSDPFEFSTSGVREEIAAAGIVIDQVSAGVIVVTGRCAVSVSLVDVTGALVRSHGPSERVTMRLDDLAAGVYFVRVKGCDGSETVCKVMR